MIFALESKRFSSIPLPGNPFILWLSRIGLFQDWGLICLFFWKEGLLENQPSCSLLYGPADETFFLNSA